MATAQAIMPFLWGANGEKLTPDEVESRRRAAERLRMPQGYTPQGWWSLLGGLARQGVAGWKDSEADKAEKAGHDAATEAFKAARENGDYIDFMSNEWATPQQMSVASALQGRAWQQEDQRAAEARAAAARAADAAKPNWQYFESGGDRYRFNENDPASKPELFFDGPDAGPKVEVINGQLVDTSTGAVKGDYRDSPPPPSAPKIEDYFDPETGRLTKRQWVDGQWQPFGGVEAPKEPLVQVNTGDAPDGALNKALSEAEGKSWAGLKDAGMVAGGLGQDLGILDELMKVAPQGPIVGPLAETFKGFNSAGDAFQSIVKRVAPSLRTPGSGATSDIEYEGFLQSLPALKNAPEANVMINSIMKAKAALNVQRSDIITAYQNGEMNVADARRKLADLNRVSIITPDMKKALLGVGATANDAPDLPNPGDLVDGYVYQGGDPSNPTSWVKQ